MTLKKLIASFVLTLFLLTPSAASAATVAELQALIAQLQAQLALAKTTAGVSVGGTTVTLVKPNDGETWKAGTGKKASVSWRAANVPTGSIAQVTLIRESDNHRFAFKENDTPHTAKNGKDSLKGELALTSGYDLGAGQYSVLVEILGPEPTDGRDRSVIASDRSDRWLNLVEDVKKPTCKVTANPKHTYPNATGPESTISWRTTGATFVTVATRPNEAASSTNKLPINGNIVVTPTISSKYYVVAYGPGGTKGCATEVFVEGEEHSSNRGTFFDESSLSSSVPRPVVSGTVRDTTITSVTLSTSGYTGGTAAVSKSGRWSVKFSDILPSGTYQIQLTNTATGEVLGTETLHVQNSY